MPLCVRSLGAYRRPGLTVRSWWREAKATGSWFLALFQRRSHTGISNPAAASGSSVALRSSFWYITMREGCCKGKHQTGDVFSIGSEGKNVNCSSCRVRGQKSKLNYRHAELEEVKVKIPGMFRPADCSLHPLCSQERERKKLNPLFFFFMATLSKVLSVNLRFFLHQSRIWRWSREVKKGKWEFI